MAQPTCTEDGCPTPVRVKNAGLCGKHYMRLRRHGSTADPVPPDPRPRFWAKVNKNGPVPEYAPHLGPCWLWTKHAWEGRMRHCRVCAADYQRRLRARRRQERTA